MIVATLLFALQTANWPIGTEREVDEGTYMQVLASQDGWRIWRTETSAGVYCRAVKSARGRPHPIPLGFHSALFRGTPFLEIGWNSYSSEMDFYWRTTYLGNVEIKYRQPGARFWEHRDNATFDPHETGENVIDVVLESWEYPELLVGKAEETATFDLDGLGWAEAEVAACVDAAPANDAVTAINDRLRRFERGSE